MRGKLMFLAGLGAGFVLGTRAGREKYEELVQAARKVRENPTVQEAAGVVQEQANKIVSGGKEMMTDKLSNSKIAETKVGERLLNAMDTEPGTERTQPLATSGTTRPTGPTGVAGTTTTGAAGTTTTGGATGTTSRH
ncbi:hypothetical protein [Planosporangium mesophilum]|uniref:YtxH domain-containing protein n=1 Tax=Planosporangium mesophilum TaxID=689768 RepID=A0A8J3X1P3_9ACTN|nr:hypothetical protein [Planosporangium mesophilum]NJC85512.1 hypothetical protein [Planosporangium mesophilum]GII24622.1 hypothetical protein Pme01_42190 [Planosporangium mesophilum]